MRLWERGSFINLEYRTDPPLTSSTGRYGLPA